MSMLHIVDKSAACKNIYTLTKSRKKNLTFWIPGISTGSIPANPFVSRLFKVKITIIIIIIIIISTFCPLKLKHVTIYSK